MEYKLINRVNSPSDLRSLSPDEALSYCEEARGFLIEKVTRQGGHLASNLGAVELNVAIHRVFDSPTDHIIFDVGHQAYVHKMITGRKELFDSLRVPGGLSGFTLSRESEHDPFGAGHSSTALSAALGLAEADRLLGNEAYTVAVIGDGAYTGGMIHEAINNCKRDLPLVVILNDNGMSISANKGAFASYLSSIRSSEGYIGLKERTSRILSSIPLIGKPLRATAAFAKKIVKNIFFRPSYFEDLGFYYLGPIDGNNLGKLERALKRAKALKRCVFVHVHTKKGKGSEPCEIAPEEFHSVSNGGDQSSYHTEFGKSIVKLAAGDGRIVAVTAGMGYGTGLTEFEKSYPERYFDVGIAEEHATTFCAGLARRGVKPYFAVYSTFLQRAFDNILHDVALQALPVRFIIDRAGLSRGDGATHHGIFDVAYLSLVPKMEIFAPISYSSLEAVLNRSLSADYPIAIRYPNAPEQPEVLSRLRFSAGDEINEFFADFDISQPMDKIFITYGSIASRVLSAKDILADLGISVGVIVAERLKPFKLLADYIARLPANAHIVFAEEGIRSGGAGMNLRSMISDARPSSPLRFEIAAIDDDFVQPDEPTDIYDYAGLSATKLSRYFMD